MHFLRNRSELYPNILRNPSSIHPGNYNQMKSSEFSPRQATGTCMLSLSALSINSWSPFFFVRDIYWEREKKMTKLKVESSGH